MSSTATTANLKGKEKEKEQAIDLTDDSSSSSDDSDLDSDSESSSSSDSEDEEPITQEYLDSLLEKARQNAALLEAQEDQQGNDDVLVLESNSQPRIPSLNPGKLPASYFTHGSSRNEPSTLSRDPDAESAAIASSSSIALPEFRYDYHLTKKQKKELKAKTTGPDWFDLPAPAEADLPRLYREVEALQLRNQLDPKRFYRKEEGEGKGIKGLPKHFAIGTIVTTKTPFGGASGENLTRAERKRTLVDELVDDAEMKRYAKRKFEDLQKVRGARGRNTLAAKKRKTKW